VRSIVLLALVFVAPALRADELPRVPPTEPRDALKTFTLAPGFRIELVACEPSIRSPVAIDFDEDGRLYVAEFPEYNLQGDPTFKERGAIKRLEDTHGDGFYDKAVTFVDNLSAPVAVACWKGGVFVGAVPNLLECRSSKNADKADVREIVYAGFDRDRAGEGMLNSIRWGLDNRFRLSTSSAGGSIRPGDQAAAKPTDVRSRFVIFDPRTRRFETTSAAGQHGMSMDDWGDTFVCDNSDPIRHIVYDGRYAARNPFAAAPPAALDIYADMAEPNLVRTSPFEPWRVARTKQRVTGIAKGPTEGGRNGGFFTGTTGVTIYRGDAFPAECRGQAVVGEVANNLVHRMTLTPNGVTFRARRADEGREFLASKDNWFRPCQFANGPDGCLYVVDIYRELIETVESIPGDLAKQLHPRSGYDRGRIWRIVPEGFVRRPLPRLSKATTAELVALLDHPNGWHRDTASRLLYERQDRAAIPLLETLTRDAKTPQGRVHALAALAGFDAIRDAILGEREQDVDAHVRAFAVKLGERFASRWQRAREWNKLARDSDLRVRLQVAFSFGASDEAGDPQGGSGDAFVQGLAADALAKLAIADGTISLMRFAILSSSRHRAASLVERLLADPAARGEAHVRLMISELTATIALARNDAHIERLLRAIRGLPEGESAYGKTLIAVLLRKLPVGHRERLDSASVRAVLTALVDDARHTSLDAKRTPAERVAAVRDLRLAAFADVRPLFAKLLQASEPVPVQKAAIEALAAYDDAGAADVLLDAWPGMSPALRAVAAESLFARPASTTRLLDRVERGSLKTSELDPARVALLKQAGDAAVRTRIDKLFAGAGLSKRADVIAAYKGALEMRGDVERGRAIFRKSCSACHRRESVGEQVGADLAGIQDKGAEFLLVNILDPNREVLPKFLAYLAQIDDGRTVTGMLTSETATGLTLRRLDGTSETILRTNLEALRSTGLSFMPEGLETQISPAQMADLIAYLLASR
jgi:putative membrane-bound dehydrogenase-like protein